MSDPVDWETKYNELLAQREEWWNHMLGEQQRLKNDNQELADQLASSNWLLAESQWHRQRLVKVLRKLEERELQTARKLDDMTDFAGEQSNARREADQQRNEIAREMADLRDDLNTAHQEIEKANELYALCSGDRDEQTERIDELEDQLKHMRQISKERDELFELLGAIWLYVNWPYATKKLTTRQRNLWADAVDSTGDPDDTSPKADRWWQHD